MPPVSSPRSTAELQDEIQAVDRRFKVDGILGSGAYGLVFRAHDDAGGKYAVKRVHRQVLHDRGLCMRIYRESRLLAHFNSPQVVGLRDIVIAPRDEDGLCPVLWLIMELMESDLKEVLGSRQRLLREHAQHIIYQILVGLKFIHAAGVVHRDMTPGNILINLQTVAVKVGDLGLARELPKADGKMTEYVTVRWYRAPEVLLEVRKYTQAVDVWAAGCILGELLGSLPLFPGSSRVNQLDRLFQVTGVPQKAALERMQASEGAKAFCHERKARPPVPFTEEKCPRADAESLDLLNQLLQLEPAKRITVRSALAHPFLRDVHRAETAAQDQDTRAVTPFEVPIAKLRTVRGITDQLYAFRSDFHRQQRARSMAAHGFHVAAAVGGVAVVVLAARTAQLRLRCSCMLHLSLRSDATAARAVPLRGSLSAVAGGPLLAPATTLEVTLRLGKDSDTEDVLGALQKTLAELYCREMLREPQPLPVQLVAGFSGTATAAAAHDPDLHDLADGAMVVSPDALSYGSTNMAPNPSQDRTGANSDGNWSAADDDQSMVDRGSSASVDPDCAPDAAPACSPNGPSDGAASAHTAPATLNPLQDLPLRRHSPTNDGPMENGRPSERLLSSAPTISVPQKGQPRRGVGTPAHLRTGCLHAALCALDASRSGKSSHHFRSRSDGFFNDSLHASGSSHFDPVGFQQLRGILSSGRMQSPPRDIAQEEAALRDWGRRRAPGIRRMDPAVVGSARDLDSAGRRSPRRASLSSQGGSVRGGSPEPDYGRLPPTPAAPRFRPGPLPLLAQGAAPGSGPPPAPRPAAQPQEPPPLLRCGSAELPPAVTWLLPPAGWYTDSPRASGRAEQRRVTVGVAPSGDAVAVHVTGRMPFTTRSMQPDLWGGVAVVFPAARLRLALPKDTASGRLMGLAQLAQCVGLPSHSALSSAATQVAQESNLDIPGLPTMQRLRRGSARGNALLQRSGDTATAKGPLVPSSGESRPDSPAARLRPCVTVEAASLTFEGTSLTHSWRQSTAERGHTALELVEQAACCTHCRCEYTVWFWWPDVSRPALQASPPAAPGGRPAAAAPAEQPAAGNDPFGQREEAQGSPSGTQKTIRRKGKSDGCECCTAQ
eukprot:TRINITY_DN64816_c0_g1_i1.p1 TRINITY_DN64816_c0_g1~~TRINITY_DN64816_c0_g1_i1.p1  ORF type:complete len:1115 (+),score=234.46 TRINITY_DN64816_c0_g1_i1:138-3482(+)